MKMKRRFVCVLLVMMLCLSMAVPVFAATNSGFNSEPAGRYIFIRGSYSVDTVRNALNTTTAVKINSDNAQLVVKIDFSNGVYLWGDIVQMSERSALSLIYNPVIPYMGTAPNYVYTCHEVRNGSSEGAYDTNCEGVLDLD